MKIGYLSAEWTDAFSDENDGKPVPGGSGWYRSHLPGRELEKHGYEVVISDRLAISDRGIVLCDHDDNWHDDIDVIVMQRIMDEFAFNLVRIAQDGGQAVVNDVDDWYWGLHPSNAAFDQSDPDKHPEVNRQHYRAAIMASDLVTCSTPFLAEKMANWGCNSTVLRNCIDLDRWTVHGQDEDPTVGWVGSTSHRSDDLETVTDVVGPFVMDNELQWHHSGWIEGWPHACEVLGIPISRSTTSRICSIYNYPLQFKPLDIGIVPLNMIDFNEAKSYIKGLEYAASGVPFVAQGTSEYVILGESGIGRVASTPGEWRDHLEDLLDYETRVKEAADNRSHLEEHDIANNWQKWAEVYEAL